MPAVGSNIQAGNEVHVRRLILAKMGFNSDGKTLRKQQNAKRGGSADAGTTFPRQIAVLLKAGVPATDTAEDAPTGVGDLCYDSTNDDVYRCSAYTDSETFTWTKIVD